MLRTLFILLLTGLSGPLLLTTSVPQQPERGQLDLWTVSNKDCTCPHEPTLKTCACCNAGGSCHCGTLNPRQCTQCGLEQYCTGMCNMTIDMRTIRRASGKTFGQIKSPENSGGPLFCWYLFKGTKNHRIELQVVEIIRVGSFNNTRCEDGHLQFTAGENFKDSSEEDTICGLSERFSPPIVMYKDHPAATLLFRVNSETTSSKFFAFFSFTKVDRELEGQQHYGGVRVPGTGCDWVFEEERCLKKGACKFSSPNYPGIFPANIRCLYLLSSSGPRARMSLIFTQLKLPNRLCDKNYIKIYRGNTTTGKVLRSLCGSELKRIEHEEKSILIEFRSGNLLPPFNYNGFLAHLEFSEVKGLPLEPEEGNELDQEAALTETTQVPSVLDKNACETAFHANISREGMLSIGLDKRLSEYKSCVNYFIGQPEDIVRLTFKTYRLGSRTCHSNLTVHDGPYQVGGSMQQLLLSKPKFNICGPVDAADDLGDEEVQYTSSSSRIALLYQRIATAETKDDYYDVRYQFISTGLEPERSGDTVCSHTFISGLSPSTGRIIFKADSYLPKPVLCAYKFLPKGNQSISIQISFLPEREIDHYCSSTCDDVTCVCETSVSMVSLDEVNHVRVMTQEGIDLMCLCGKVATSSPYLVRTNQVVSVVVHTVTGRSLVQSIIGEYQFYDDSTCYKKESLQSKDLQSDEGQTGITLSHQVHHLVCDWHLPIPENMNILLTILGPKTNNCQQFNITLAAVARPNVPEPDPHEFCGGPNKRVIVVPTNYSGVDISIYFLSSIRLSHSLTWKIVTSEEMESELEGLDQALINNAAKNSTINSTVILVLGFILLWIFLVD